MNDELTLELLEAIKQLRSELRQLRHGELVARLTDAERHAIADIVSDRLDERYAAERTQVRDQPPRRGRASAKGYFPER